MLRVGVGILRVGL